MPYSTVLQGRYGVFGITGRGDSVLLRLLDFRPYFYIAAPLLQASPTHRWAPSAPSAKKVLQKSYLLCKPTACIGAAAHR